MRWRCGGGMASVRPGCYSPGLPASRPGGVANACPRLFGGRGRETDPVRPHGRAASRRCLPSDSTVKAVCRPCGFNGGGMKPNWFYSVCFADYTGDILTSNSEVNSTTEQTNLQIQAIVTQASLPASSKLCLFLFPLCPVQLALSRGNATELWQVLFHL